MKQTTVNLSAFLIIYNNYVVGVFSLVYPSNVIVLHFWFPSFLISGIGRRQSNVVDGSFYQG